MAKTPVDAYYCSPSPGIEFYAVVLSDEKGSELVSNYTGKWAPEKRFDIVDLWSPIHKLNECIGVEEVEPLQKIYQQILVNLLLK